MKTLVLIPTLLSLAFIGTTAQRPEADAQRKPSRKHVEVTAATVAKQPGGKPYAIDLTRRGTIYTLAEGTDYARVRVRTSKGYMTVADLLQKAGKKVSGKLQIAQTSDLRAERVRSGGGTRRGGRGLIDCGDLACFCSGEDDCIELLGSDKCGPIAVCYPDGCICIRL